MKVFSILRRLANGARKPDRQAKEHWARDPLAHPDLEAMSERELADLPFSRGLRRSTDC